MCLHHPLIGGTARWNWDGDRIVFDTVFPSGRPPVGRSRPSYRMDIREYVVSQNNAMMKATLHEDIVAFIAEQRLDPQRFTGRSPYDFDFRANVIAAFVSQRIQYQATHGRDPWQFPEETLFLKRGDCEDIAFLLASLLLASGISGYNVRVALGKVVVHPPTGRSHVFDHMWVMYKCEAGHWLLLEPLHLKQVPHKELAHRRTLSPTPDCVAGQRVEYKPSFLFNDEHVWIVDREGGPERVSDAVNRAWVRINPRFAGEVHQTIINAALSSVAPDAVVQALNRHFSRIFGQTVDDVDNFITHGYDPRDHFDNGFITEGWAVVQKRLEAFKGNNQDLDSFAYAAHGIADFYAHSSYAHFADLENPADDGGLAKPCDPANPIGAFVPPPAYDGASHFDLGSGKFSINPHVYKGPQQSAPNVWKGQLISGRYAQARDSHSAIEAATFIPKELIDKTFPNRGALPHHNEIAVDSELAGKGHLLYANDVQDRLSRLSYQNQFRWRKNGAIAHVKQAFLDNWIKDQ